MHLYYKFGLLLIFILSLSTRFTRAAPPPALHNSSLDDGYVYYEDYYDENEVDRNDNITTVEIVSTDEATSPMPSTTIPNRLPTTKKSKLYISTPRSIHVVNPTCPEACRCLESYKHILCNGAGLTQVPKDLPTTSLIIDLSQNNIIELRPENFANISKILEINLSGNRLKTINKEIFGSFKYLQRLRLTDNEFTHVEPDTFSGAIELSELDLSNNPIVLRSDGPFLVQPSLLKFACRNCSWSQLYDDTFTGLTSLNSLKLDSNDFDKKINAKALTPLQSIIKLRLPELEAASVTELCNLLKTIDNISFKQFDISCFELVLGTSFNESITLVTDPPYIPSKIAIFPTKVPETAPTPNREVSKNKERGSENKPTKAAVARGTTPAPIAKNQDSEVKMSEETNSSNLTISTAATIVEEAVGSPKPVPTILTAGVLSGTGDAATNSTESVTVKSVAESDNGHQVNISQETVNLLLICIIIVAIVGIIIGIICRRDVGGIKTRCCRTKKTEPKEQVHPAEEIPLNKLT